MAFAASSTCSDRRELATTSAPASASPIAIASPIPDVPPTTTADLPPASNNGSPIQNRPSISKSAFSPHPALLKHALVGNPRSPRADDRSQSGKHPSVAPASSTGYPQASGSYTHASVSPAVSQSAP